MSDMNSFSFSGRLSGEPELKYLPTGTAVCEFSVAVNKPPRNGQEQDADFFDCLIYGRPNESGNRNQAEAAAEILYKGREVGVEGRMTTRFYDNNEGRRVKVYEVVVDNFKPFGPSKEQRAAQGNGDSGATGNGSAGQSQGNGASQGSGNGGSRSQSSGQAGGSRSSGSQSGGAASGSRQGQGAGAGAGNRQGGSRQGGQGGQRGTNHSDPFANGGGAGGGGRPDPFKNDPFANDGKPIDISDDDLPY